MGRENSLENIASHTLCEIQSVLHFAKLNVSKINHQLLNALPYIILLKLQNLVSAPCVYLSFLAKFLYEFSYHTQLVRSYNMGSTVYSAQFLISRRLTIKKQFHNFIYCLA